jgi:hypothetical protein
MNWERLYVWLDNPILVKHMRSRLRKQPLAAAMVVVSVFCICIAWAGIQLQSLASGGTFGLLLGLQSVILVVMGATQVGSAVGAARASGILDFHRVSPLTPTELTLGFFFGAPIREYVLFACTLPFSLCCLAFGTPSVHGFVQLMVLLVACAWLFHGLALLNALLAKARANPRGVVGLIIFVVFFGGNLIFGLRRSAALVDMDLRLTFFGISLPWLAVVLLHQAVVLYFIYLAARRKMGSERIHPLSKPQAIAALASLAVLLVGTIWRREEFVTLEIATIYLLVITAILLIMMVTPNLPEYDKGLWRARRMGLAHLPWWDDLSLNRVILVIACAIVLATATVASGGAADSTSFGPASRVDVGSFPLAIAAGVLVVAYFGLAHQYFALRFGARARIYFSLFLFLAWVVPLLAGSILLMASMPIDAERESQVVFSLSPVAGIGLTAIPQDAQGYQTAIQAAVITPALLFVFVFNTLLVSARRQVYKGFTKEAASENLILPPAPTEGQDGKVAIEPGTSPGLQAVPGITGGLD